ncbi:RING-8 protein [Magnaporthiopsis poae ATCC 64411]|uniref:RING-8 protein n=1 Tax=Magnaporthiopsis poae (strain ATCC 64411 / 73-15) TaxID=644358 RepID=A0A0C4DKV1_MAGP6|nr:RING-8 protein [Magnaporthiopsis poae ATCC 64411]
MALINAAVLDGVRIVVRQASETLSSSTPSGPAPTSSSTTTAAAPADTNVNGSPASPGGNSPPNNTNGNSPLLFFVALGFGVVFTNLWIIVGVKYCFRYNARNRAMRVNEDGEPITLENMPRPRRRREKKLMTMDEVNEKFPMQKYKSWVASRAHQGLSTRGGVDVPPSRAGSVRSVQGIIPDLASKERSSTEDRPTTSAAKTKPEVNGAAKPETKENTSTTTAADPKTDNATTETETAASGQPAQSDSAAAEPDAARPSESEEDDEHINAALPPEFMTSGDTCAICIDSLDDDEDVRGLTCGHAFHAVCVDPWLTSRRACCPLCKADYYTPKPRPAAPEATNGADNSTGVITVVLPENGRRSGRQPRSQSTWMSFRSRGRSNANGNNAPAQRQRRQNAPRANTNSDSTPRSGGILARFRPAAATGAAQQSPTETAAPPQPQGQTGGFLSNLRLPFGRGQQQQQGSGATATPATPSQLEAGTATPAR